VNKSPVYTTSVLGTALLLLVPVPRFSGPSPRKESNDKEKERKKFEKIEHKMKERREGRKIKQQNKK